MTTQSNIYLLASLQGGVIRRDQLIEAGVSRSQLERRIASGDWHVVSTGGYRLIDMQGRLNRVRAAVTILPAAVASHFSAAAMHGIPLVPTDTVSVTVHARTTHTFPRVRVFRSLDLDRNHVTRREGLPVTTLDRTVVDLAACLKPRHLGVVVDELLASSRCEVESMRDTLESVARRGRSGVATMRSVLDKRSDAPQGSSRLERAGLELLRDAGFSRFALEFSIPWTLNKRFDVAFPDDRVAIEWDSRRWHTQAQAFQRDRERDREALAHGWRVIRFTWDDVHGAPLEVIATIRAVLDQQILLSS